MWNIEFKKFYKKFGKFFEKNIIAVSSRQKFGTVKFESFQIVREFGKIKKKLNCSSKWKFRTSFAKIFS